MVTDCRLPRIKQIPLQSVKDELLIDLMQLRALVELLVTIEAVVQLDKTKCGAVALTVTVVKVNYQCIFRFKHTVTQSHFPVFYKYAITFLFSKGIQ